MQGNSNIPDSRGINFFTSDSSLGPLLRRYLGADLYDDLLPQRQLLGARASDQLDEWELAADKHPPELRHRNRRGEPIQQIENHPSYIELERVAFSKLGLAAMSHRGNLASPLVKCALTFLVVQAEFGACCPVSMTDSLTRTLRKFGSRDLVDKYLLHLTSLDFRHAVSRRDVHDRVGRRLGCRPDSDARIPPRR